MIVEPDEAARGPVPVVLWMHGRTAHKEIDPGRYLRLMRGGVGVCAVDMPGHGERYDAALQNPERTLDVILRAIDEIDDVVAGLPDLGRFDPERVGVGGMSAGGMAALARLCRPHRFRAASVEAATGAWQHQRRRPMFAGRADAEIDDLDPLANLARWRELPLQAIHARHDEWVAFAGQAAFIEALRARYRDPGRIDFVVYDRTGAPYEHAGFGRMASEAKNRQRDFFVRWL